MKINPAKLTDPEAPNLPRCSFCARDQHAVDLLVAGDNHDAFICPACVELARDIIGAHRLGVMEAP